VLEPLLEAVQGAADEARDLHLRHADAARDLGLREVLDEAQVEHLAIAVVEHAAQGAQRRDLLGAVDAFVDVADGVASVRSGSSPPAVGDSSEAAVYALPA